jgi:hypothetical protein
MTVSAEPQAPASVTVSAWPTTRTWISLLLVALGVWLLIRYGTLLIEVVAVVFGATVDCTDLCCSAVVPIPMA